MRALIRKPDVLILEEAGAHIDTLTKELLEQALQRRPLQTSKAIIAHHLNTIESADEIYFINEGSIRAAGSMQQAVEMLMHQRGGS